MTIVVPPSSCRFRQGAAPLLNLTVQLKGEWSRPAIVRMYRPPTSSSYKLGIDGERTRRVLTDRVGNPLRLVAEKFARRGGFELRSSNEVHDRVIFVDDRCWLVGQSIKDAAKKKPTYIVEHSGAATMKGIYEAIWTKAVVVVKG